MVEIKGKQYKAEKGALLKVDRLAEDAGKKVEFDSVLLLGSEGDVKIGTPYVKGVKVSAEVVEHIKDKKVVVFKYRRRKDSMSKNGHRQQYSMIKITGVKTASAAKKAAEDKTETTPAAKPAAKTAAKPAAKATAKPATKAAAKPAAKTAAKATAKPAAKAAAKPATKATAKPAAKKPAEKTEE